MSIYIVVPYDALPGPRLAVTRERQRQTPREGWSDRESPNRRRASDHYAAASKTSMVFIHLQTRDLLLHLGGMREQSRNGAYGLSQMVRPNAWAAVHPGRRLNPRIAPKWDGALMSRVRLYGCTATEGWSDEQRRAEPAAGLVYRFDTDATGTPAAPFRPSSDWWAESKAPSTCCDARGDFTPEEDRK